MTVMGILQARTSSSRLPGKVLKPILGKPMILRQIERLSRAHEIDTLVVATSTDPSDDALADVLENEGIQVYRGSLDDVLSRFERIIKDFQPEIVVRLTADCPLTSPCVIDDVIRKFHESQVDYVSNTLRPTFPDGLDVEVTRASAILWVAENSRDPHEREHVTLGIYRRPEQFSLLNFASTQDLGQMRWTVDTPDDFEFVQNIYARLYPDSPKFEFQDILELLRSDSSIRPRLDTDVKRNAALEGLDTGAMEHE